MDGVPTEVLSRNVIGPLKKQNFDHGTLSVSSNLSLPQPLEFEVDTTIEASIAMATNAAKALVSSHTLSFLRTSYGKRQIKAFGFSPDSWVQMIIQLAYHRLNGGRTNINGGTYEAATTRLFQHGRTETIRVVSEESVRWCESMDTPGMDGQEVRQLLRSACNAHGASARDAGNGQGIDRLMFGMIKPPSINTGLSSGHNAGLQKMLRPGEDAPELFTDNLFLRSKHWVLSTSTIYGPHFRVYGWGEVVPDGFGVAYVSGHDGW